MRLNAGGYTADVGNKAYGAVYGFGLGTTKKYRLTGPKISFLINNPLL